MSFKFKNKFSEKHIDEFIQVVYEFINSKKKKLFLFDFSQTERIANQNLLLLSSIFKYFVEEDIEFKIKLFQDNFNNITKRQSENAILLWEKWIVYQFIPNDKDLTNYFILNNKRAIRTSLELLKKKYKLASQDKLYNTYGITPFTYLPQLDDFQDISVLRNIINPIYLLNDSVKDTLTKYNCEHPFLNNTLSAIITKELYENFLDHFESPFFKSKGDWAFLSLALKTNLINNDQSLLEKNFEEEELSETKSFFYDEENKIFKNENYIQFSFLDFGEGIVNSLFDEYNKIEDNGLFHDENNILKFAFQHNSSRHPISGRYQNIEKLIPRGLFDVITIVKRYQGLLIVRSNKGKIAYDFSNGKNIAKAYRSFGNKDVFFPGTFITIYIPPLQEIDNDFDYSSIKPITTALNYSEKIPEAYLSLFSIINELSTQNHSKSVLYQKSIEKLRQLLLETNKLLIFIDFQGWEIDSRITKVLLFYLATDYNINLNKNIVIINPPKEDYLRILNNELFELLQETKTFQTHPLPFIFFDNQSEELSIYWFGVYNENDVIKLNDLLFGNDKFDLRKSDFEDPKRITEKFNWFDNKGNLLTIFPNGTRISKFHKKIQSKYEEKLIQELLNPSILETKSTIQANKKLYLCSGNYYTKGYLKLDNIIINNSKTDILSNLLYKKIEKSIGEINNHKFISITSSSNKIVKSLIRQKLISESNVIFIENYHKNLIEHELQDSFKTNGQYVLVCDVIATGFLTNKIKNELKDIYNSELVAVAVFVNSIDQSFRVLDNDLQRRLYALQKFPIKKFLKKDIPNLDEYLINRINPFTNQPITLKNNSLEITSTALTPAEFAKYCKGKDLRIKFLEFNNAIHPYFFNMYSIIQHSGNELIQEIFQKIPEENKKEIDIIFYPQKSAIDQLDLHFLKANILKNQKILDFEIERFPTRNGWRFPHLSTFYREIAKNKKLLILDDAACSGDSILQFIDEVSFLEVREIILVILLSRLSDQRVEFYSKLKQIVNSKGKSVPIKIYFGCHWQISTYSVFNNPIINETYWLNSLIQLINTPSTIRNIAEKINSELQSKNYLSDNNDYKYFPKLEAGGIDKVELFSMRNIIGKITGFRFYIDNFSYFNELFFKKTDFSDKIQNKPIELICSIFLYEPFLFENVKSVLPDLAGMLREFVDKIILEKSIDAKNNLFYVWDKKDLMHLFFIIYSGKELLNKLKMDNNFVELVEFSRYTFKRTNPINYLLYKFLKYFPLTKKELNLKTDYHEFKELINYILEEKIIDEHSLAELRRFYSFTNTLPSDETFESQLDKIKSNYRIHRLPKTHDQQQSLNHHITQIVVTLRSEFRRSPTIGNKFEESHIKKIKDNWWNIKHSFLEPIISFYRTFDDFFKPYPYAFILSEIETSKVSLIQMYTFLDDFVFNINQRALDSNNISKAIEFIERIQVSFGLGSKFNKLFEKPTIKLKSLVSDIEESFSEINSNIIKNSLEFNDVEINIPVIYVEKLIVGQLEDNMLNYSDSTKSIKIDYSIFNNKNGENYMMIKISNSIKKDVTKFSGYEGISNLKSLSDSDLFNFKYDYIVKKVKAEQKFIQKITFKI